MSCCVLEREEIATIANTLELLLNRGYNYFGFDAEDDLFCALSDCRDSYGDFYGEVIYTRLSCLNIAAYCCRYNEEFWSIPDYPNVKSIVEQRRVELGADVPQQWHYDFVKLLDRFCYQCEEEINANDPLLKALEDLSTQIKCFIVNHTAAYRYSKI